MRNFLLFPFANLKSKPSRLGRTKTNRKKSQKDVTEEDSNDDVSMAGVTTTTPFLHIEDLDDDPHPTRTLGDHHPYWAHHDLDRVYSDRRRSIVTVHQDDDYEDDCDDLFSQYQSTVHVMRGGGDRVSEPNPMSSNPDVPDRENQVSFVMDLLEQRVEQSQVTASSVSGCRVVNDESDVDVDGLELDLNLGLGSGSRIDFSHCGDDDDLNDDYGDYFFGRRVSRSESGGGGSNLGGTEALEDCMRLVDFGTDSDEDDNGVIGIDLNSMVDEFHLPDDNDSDDDTTSIPLCWFVDDHRESNDDFEWEEVDGGVDERDVFSMFVAPDHEEELGPFAISAMIAPGEEVNVVERNAEPLDSLQWEVLLNANNWEANVEGEPFPGGDQDDYIYAADYDMLFGQFSENENASMGRPPAATFVVENLPSVVVTKEDVEKSNAVCAVCKDDMNVGEQSKQLPCAHRYHGDCIVPWLCIRNTCPVCRHELPTDDPAYERRRTQRPSPGFDYGEVVF